MMDRHSSIKICYNSIAKFLKEISDVLGKNIKNNPEWNHYREYVNDIVISGKTHAIVEALKNLLKRI